MRTLISILTLTVLTTCDRAIAVTWTTLDYPGATETGIRGFDGKNIVGWCNQGCFISDGTNWNIVNLPGVPTGISGSTVVGYFYTDEGYRGYVYNGATWTILSVPGADDTYAIGTSGNNIVGRYDDDFGIHGFLYNMTTWNTLDYPNGTVSPYSYARGFSGNDIFGFWGADGTYLYNGTTWVDLNIHYPGARATLVYGINQNIYVGQYDADNSDGRNGSFVYDSTAQSYTAINYPGAISTQVYGMSGDDVFGEYYDAHGCHGFIYAIPEPTTIIFFIIGLTLNRNRFEFRSNFIKSI
jgi:hypothetical protein